MELKITAFLVSTTLVLGTAILVLLVFSLEPGRQFSWPTAFAPLTRLFTASSTQINQRPAQQWTFDFSKDSNNHGLTEEQCMLAFPLLTKEIDRAVDYRRKNGNTTEEDLDIAWRGHGILRVLIRDHQLYIVDTLNVERGHRARYLATLNSIQTAIAGYPGNLPVVEFTICVQDNCLMDDGNEDRITFGYSRTAEQESLWLMPDFGFWGWPTVGMSSYTDLRTTIANNEPSFTDKIPQLVWRGMVDPGRPTRGALVRQSKGQPWSDVYALNWEDEKDKQEHMISQEDHCNYMFTAMTEGMTWSGRFKFLLNCHSTIISHELSWIEFYHHLLSDNGTSQNYIVLDRDFNGLPDVMERLLEPGDQLNEALRIATNARRVFREQYLTPAAISCYWRALFRGWASVQGFKPRLWEERAEEDAGGNGTATSRRKSRGVPFESYTIMEALEWEIKAQPRKLVINDLTFY